jgi:hypothetical protein
MKTKAQTQAGRSIREPQPRKTRTRQRQSDAEPLILSRKPSRLGRDRIRKAIEHVFTARGE